MTSSHLPTRSTPTEVAEFLRQAARTPLVTGTRGRLIFALDATASRQATWDRACQFQGDMFAAAAELGGLDLQLVWYRGTGEFQAEPWLNDTTELQRRMTSVQCRGGLTQIGRVLDHAIRETRRHRINALVLVGDCLEEDPDPLCHQAGQLALLGVPAFVFQEGSDPRAAPTAPSTPAVPANFASYSAPWRSMRPEVVGRWKILASARAV